MNLPENLGRLIKTISRGISEPSRGAFLWVGAGLSIPAGYPSLGQLADRLQQESLTPLAQGLTPFETIDAFVAANGKGFLLQQLTDVFLQKRPLDFHRDLIKLPWNGIITTNYDELLEDALKDIDRPYLKVTLDQNLDLTAGPRIPLYKVHGDIADFQKVVLDGRSYATFNRRYPLLKADLESILRKYSLTFLGCSMTDPRLLGWLRRLGRGRRAALMPSSTVMTAQNWQAIPAPDRQLLEEGNIQPVLVQDYAEIPELIRHLVREIVPPSSSVFHFVISSVTTADGPRWKVASGAGEREVAMPWQGNYPFVEALREFSEMAERPAVEEEARTSLQAHAVRLGEALAEALLTEADRQHLRDAFGQDGPPPLATLESSDDLILTLPWELLRLDGEFMVREGRIDLVRTVPAVGSNPPTLTPPDRYLRLVVHVAAPEEDGQGQLNYEAESYRLLKALYEHSEVVFTELGTAEDLVAAVVDNEPLGVHFSGHGMPGGLQFEDEEGRGNSVAIQELLRQIRERAPAKFPRFFYLASCHGNDPARPEADEPGARISAAHLHREGVTQVIGYFGPIVDEFSTLAEVAVYRALAEGRPTRDGVRQARASLARGPETLEKGVHRREAAHEWVAAFPFAWAQLVLYHRGPDYPLSKAIPAQHFQAQEAGLQRHFEGADKRQILTTGFIGRRRERHQFRRACRTGKHTFVFQGLGGLGKSTLAFQALPLLTEKGKYPLLTFWCRDHEDEENQAQVMAEQLSDFAQGLLGDRWLQVVQAADRMPEATEAQRFGIFLQALLQDVNHLVVYLDNLESLLSGPDNEDAQAFGDWRSEEVAAVWQILKERSGDMLSVVASCRYRHSALEGETIHVGEMGDNALFRMMGWFDTLRRFSVVNRARLVDQLHGHPRAVEFLEGLLHPVLKKWQDRYGEWKTPTEPAGIEQEWQTLIESALPQVEEKVQQDLLLGALWQRVLGEQGRRMLFRMTVLRRPWDWDLMMQLGESEGQTTQTERAAEQLRATSLVGEVREWQKERWVRLFQVHPMTARFVAQQFDQETAAALRLETCKRMGTYLEALVPTSSDLRVHMDAGHYLFQCGEFDRACFLQGGASQNLQRCGRVKAGLDLLAPFKQVYIFTQLTADRQSRLLGTMGNAYLRLSQVEQAIEYHQQALAISQGIGDRRGVGEGLGNLGVAYAHLGQVEKAIQYYEQALAISQEIGNRQSEDSSLGNLGNAYLRLGQVEKAIEYYQRSLTISQEIGNRRGQGEGLGNLGLALLRLGEVGKAIECFDQALVICQEVGNLHGVGSALGNLGNAYDDLGKVEKAIEYYYQALAISREIGDRQGEGSALGNLGTAYGTLGQVEKAVEYYHQALVISQEISDRQGEGNRLGNLGNAYLRLDQVEKAIEYHQQALVISRQIGDRRGEGNRLGNLGIAYARLDQVGKAIECYQQALVISRETGDRRGEGSALGKLGQTLADLGQSEQAKECLEVALAIAREIMDPKMEAAAISGLIKLG